MKPIGLSRKTLLIVRKGLLLCFGALLIPAYWTALFSARLLLAISCLTLHAAQGMNALSRSIAGAIWRLLIVTSRILRRHRSRMKAATISGT
jgi:hypothetical protein